MNICTFASGSSGNCALVSEGNTHLLIDAGISMRRIKQSLCLAGLTPSDISGILVTHEHRDHINGLNMITKYYRIPIYISPLTSEAVCCQYPEIRDCVRLFRPGEKFNIGEISVLPFKTPHDTPESVGYRFESESGIISFATDMGYPTKEVFSAIKGSDTVVIESNHDTEMLKNGPYPYYLKRRILSKYGHLSNADCGKMVSLLAAHGTKHVILAHLSRENNTPRLALETVEDALKNSGAVPGRDISIHVAPADEPDSLYIT